MNRWTMERFSNCDAVRKVKQGSVLTIETFAMQGITKAEDQASFRPNQVGVVSLPSRLWTAPRKLNSLEPSVNRSVGR